MPFLMWVWRRGGGAREREREREREKIEKARQTSDQKRDVS
jgi:hypothetical protein